MARCQWEYGVTSQPIIVNPKHLNEMAANGWELCETFSSKDDIATTVYTHIWKRKLDEDHEQDGTA